MKLTTYLDEKSVSPREFATTIGVSPEAVRLYLKGARRPRSEIMNAIHRATEGAVTANDFFAMEGPT